MNETTLAARHLPAGGLRVSPRLLRRWRLRDPQAAVTEPVRCKRNEWYLVRAAFSQPRDLPAACPFGWRLRLRFGDGRRVLRESFAELAPWACDPAIWLGWVHAPEDATHVALVLDDGPQPAELTLHPVAEPDIRSHPLANVPAWEQYTPAPPIERIVLPASLPWLEPLLAASCDGELRVIRAPRSLRALAREVVGSAWVFDPAWIDLLNWPKLRTLAEASRVVLDLATFARLTGLRLIERGSDYDVFSARVEYADFPTRGFALQDVFAWCTFDGRRFRQRVLRRGADWRRLAARDGFCTLLTNETPWENRNGDIVAAMREAGTGQLIVSDAALMAAGPVARGQGQRTRAQGAERRAPVDAEHRNNRSVGPPCPTSDAPFPPADGGSAPSVVSDLRVRREPARTAARRAETPDATGVDQAPLAPRLAAHLLRMMLGLPIEPAARYRVREPEDDIVVRDIADLARHYPPLRAVRWQSRTSGVVELGLWLPAGPRPQARPLVLHTGRIDRCGPRTGWPPEPMMIVMRRLALERGRAGASRADRDIFWQFSSACGTRYATLFEAAPRLDPHAVEWVDLTAADVLRELPPVGCAGDGSLEQQAALERRVRKRIQNEE